MEGYLKYHLILVYLSKGCSFFIISKRLNLTICQNVAWLVESMVEHGNRKGIDGRGYVINGSWRSRGWLWAHQT